MKPTKRHRHRNRESEREREMLPPHSVAPPDATGQPTASRKIIGWANNLLATALVLIVALTLGIKVIQYWRSDAAPTVSSIDRSGPPSLNATTHLAFPNLSETLARRQFRGTPDQLIGTMADQCQRILEQAHPPDSIPLPASLGEKEGALVKSLQSKEPYRESKGRWRIHIQKGPIPMAIGVQLGLKTESNVAKDSGRKSRVLCWSLALPSLVGSKQGSEEPTKTNDGKSEEFSSDSKPNSPTDFENATSSLDGASTQTQAIDHWTLLTCQPLGRAATKSTSPRWMKLPAGAHENLTVRTQEEGLMVGFSGRGEIENWKQFFASHLDSIGWKCDPWRTTPTGWHTRALGPSQEILYVMLDNRATQLTGMFRYRTGELSTKEE